MNDKKTENINIPIDLPYTSSEIENQISKKNETTDELIENFFNDFSSPGILFRVLNIVYGINDINKRNNFIEKVNIFEKEELQTLKKLLKSDRKILQKIVEKQKEESEKNALTIQKIMKG